jgi:beta-glucosidase
VIGETPYAEGAGDIRGSGTLEHARRHPEDLAVLDQVAGHGVPVVTVLLSGRPLWVNREIDRSDAFVAAWLPGTEGLGLTDVLFRHADGGRTDFRGRLSYSWPRSACQAAVNKGDADDRPLFAYGYGLTYARPQAALARLDESPQPERCGARMATATDDLVIFRQVENPTFPLYIGSPAGWAVRLGDDPNAVVATSDGFAKAETTQVNVQQDARKVTLSGDSHFAASSDKPQDLSGFQATQAAVVVDVVVEQAPTGPVRMQVECGFPCRGAVDVTPALRALPLHQKATLRVPLQCFVDRGADLASVEAPFAISTKDAFTASFANIRWEVGGATAPGALPCPSKDAIPPS